MKSTLLSLALLMGATMVVGQSKISPDGRIYLQRASIERQLNENSKLSTDASEPEVIKVLVTLSEGATAEDLEGYSIDCTVGDKFVVVDMPLSKIEELAELPAVNYVSFGEMKEPYLNQANDDTGVAVLHTGGEGLPKAFNGEGVIAGVFDTGVDPNHVAFRAEDGTTYRVKRFFNLNNNVTYTEDNMSSATTDKTTETHGTHVSGIIGGKGGQNGSYGGYSVIFGQTKPAKVNGAIPFEGVANKAELALSGGTLTNSNIVSACKKIADYAKSEGKRAVINLSMGAVYGPHDGSTALCQSLDEIAKEVPIFISAGNDGDLKVSISKVLSSSDNKIATFVNPKKVQVSANTAFWANDNKSLSCKLGFYDVSAGKSIGTIDVAKSMTISGTYYPQYTHDDNFNKAFTESSYIIFDKGIDANNGCSYVAVYMNVTRNSTTNPNCNIVPYFQVSGTSGTRLLATTSEEFGNMGIAGFDDGNGENSINDDACAKNVIAVGAYCTRPSWITLGGKSYSYTDTPTNGDIADFSSYGLSLDGRNLPHLAGPGYGIISTYSQYYYTNANLGSNDVCGYVNANGRDNYWANEQGTSMSSPYVAGVGCLLLQANPSLTTEELRNILIETATKDDFVNNGNKVQWGAGKVNALAAVKKALDMGGVGTIYADENLRLIVSPAGNKCYDVFLAGVDGFKATLYSLSGVAVKSVAIDGNEGVVDASELSSGIYVMEVKADNAHFTKKIVVK